MLERPSLPGFSFREASVEDIPAMLAVHEASRERDQVDPNSICYRLPNLPPEAYREHVAASPPETTLIAEREGQIVAHAFMDAWGFDERLYLWRVWVKPEVRGQGVGTAMHRWGEARAKEIHGNDPRPALHLANATEHEQDAVGLLEFEGYHLNFVSPELAFDAFDALPVGPSLPGIEIRTLSPADERLVARALAEANLITVGEENRWTPEALQQRLDEWEPEWIEQVRKADPSLSPIAWSGDEVAGVYLGQRNGAIGEVSQVAVRATWRGRGIARALAMDSLRRLRDAGCTTVRLFTSMGPDETEPTDGPYAMYRKFGFVPIARHLRFRKSF